MTSLPDWLVERVALDEVPASHREQVERADPRELAERIAALREDNARELAHHPAGPAVAQIDARAAERRAIASQGRRRRRLAWFGLATTAAAIVVVARLLPGHPPTESSAHPGEGSDEITRTKGATRLVAFRQIGDQVERLEPDALVHAGDLLQLRYNAGGHPYGVIASLDGAGVVTLHFPASEDAPPQATAVAAKTVSLPHAYALDDAPRFERFIFITANEPIDVQQSLAALRALAQRTDSADAPVELPSGLRQWSLRLRKPSSPNHELP